MQSVVLQAGRAPCICAWRCGRTYKSTRKLDRVWIISALVPSVQSAHAWGSKTHPVFLLYGARPFVTASGAALSVSFFHPADVEMSHVFVEGH